MQPMGLIVTSLFLAGMVRFVSVWEMIAALRGWLNTIRVFFVNNSTTARKARQGMSLSSPVCMRQLKVLPSRL